MSIDKQRVRGVELLEQLGYRWNGVAWLAPGGNAVSIQTEADAMHSILMDRADVLAGASTGATEEEELEAIGGALEAYEAKRWPLGKVLVSKAGIVRRRLGRPGAEADKVAKARGELAKGTGILKTAKLVGLGTGTVQKLKREMAH